MCLAIGQQALPYRILQNAVYILYILLLLTAIGLSPGVSSAAVVQTKIKIHKTTITTKQLQNINKNIKQQNNYKTIKISTQTEHSKWITKTYTHILQNI
jgi:hypothetical protein